MTKEYDNPFPKQGMPKLRIRVLADGFPSGSIIIQPSLNTLHRMNVPPEGNDAWCNASSYIDLQLAHFTWIDNRTLMGTAALNIDGYVAGEPTPFTLIITPHYCNPCGMVQFAKRIQELQFGKPGALVHQFALVFDHMQ